MWRVWARGFFIIIQNKKENKMSYSIKDVEYVRDRLLTLTMTPEEIKPRFFQEQGYINLAERGEGY
jgi:hypothetical protein